MTDATLLGMSNTALLDPTQLNTELANVLQRVTIKELPTSAHLSYFLNTFYSNDTPGAAAYTHWIGSLPPTVQHTSRSPAPDPSYLPFHPTLVILHNPSDYLAEEHAQHAGVEAYANLLALFRATFAPKAGISSSSGPTASPLVILHDRAAGELRLPLLAPHLRPPKKPRLTERDQEAKQYEEEDVPLAQIVRMFFDQVGVADRVLEDPTAGYTSAERRFRLVFDTRSEGTGIKTIEWVVKDEPVEEEGDRVTTTIQLVLAS